MCGRGFLDKQKFDVQKASTTASRISQRLAVSLAHLERLELELWDISNAFLQGMSFDELHRRAKELNIEIKKKREIYFRPPANVWRHLKDLDRAKFNITLSEHYLYILILLKPMYGLVDAPFLWGLILSVFIRHTLGGTASFLDKEFYYWTANGHIEAIFTAHEDDILAIASQRFLKWSRELVEKRFGDVKRQCLPFTHIGIEYTRLPNGSISRSEPRYYFSRLFPKFNFD